MIIDSFLFNKDFASLEIRLSELSEIVDLFVKTLNNITSTIDLLTFSIMENVLYVVTKRNCIIQLI